MMIRLKNGKTTAIDYREMGPAAAHRDVYLDKDGNLIKGEGSQRSAIAQLRARNSCAAWSWR